MLPSSFTDIFFLSCILGLCSTHLRVGVLFYDFKRKIWSAFLFWNALWIRALTLTALCHTHVKWGCVWSGTVTQLNDRLEMFWQNDSTVLWKHDIPTGSRPPLSCSTGAMGKALVWHYFWPGPIGIGCNLGLAQWPGTHIWASAINCNTIED